MANLDGLSAVSAHAPRTLPDLVERDRLRELLRPLPAIGIVRGPSGAGKTVLLRQLVDEMPQARGAWISAHDELARDAFWALVLTRALGSENPVTGVRGVITALRSVDESLVIVVDEADEIVDRGVLSDILAVARAVPTVSFLIGTRMRLTELEAPHHALSTDIRVIDPDDLRFTEAEMIACVGMPPQSAAELIDLTGGNALLVRAVRLTAQRGAVDIVSGATSVLRGHLQRQLADIEVDAVFLHRTALSADFSSDEAKDLTGDRDPQHAIDRLEAAGLLTRHDEGDQARYRYHRLVREELRAQLHASRPQEVPKLHAVVSRQRFARGEQAAALEHALHGRDFEYAARVLLLGGTDLLESVSYAAIAMVPLRIAAHHPTLAAARALKENARGSRWVAKEFFAAAIMASRSIAVRNIPERASMAVIESVVARLHGRRKESVACARRAMALIDRLGTDSALGEQVYQLTAMCAVSFFRGGDEAGLRDALSRIPTSASRGSLVAASLRAIRAATAGDWGRVAAVEEALTPGALRAAGADGYRGALVHLALMLRDLAKADTAAALQRIEALGAHMPTLEYRVLFAAAQAVAMLIDGEFAKAHRISYDMRRAEEAAHRLSPADADLLALVDALVAVCTGAVGEAQRILQTVDPGSRWACLLKAHLDLLQGDQVGAARHLGDELLDGGDARIARARVLLMAWLALQTGEVDAARSALRNFGDLTRVRGEDGSLMLVPAEIRIGLVGLCDADEDGRVVRAQLNAPLASPFEMVPAHPRLTARELTVLRQLRSHSSIAEIAAALGVSANTVKTQLRSAYRKLGVSDRAQALVRMTLLGVGEADPTRSTGAAGTFH